MAVIKMQKVLLAIHQSDLEKALSRVQKFGNFELANINIEEEGLRNFEKGSQETDLNLAELDFAIRLLSPYEHGKKTFREKVLGVSVESTEKEVKKIAENFDFKPITKECAKIEENINEQKIQLARIADLRATLKAWKNLKFPLKFEAHAEHAEMKIGEVNVKDYEDLAISIARHDLAHLEVVQESKINIHFLLVFHRSISEEILPILESARFVEIDFSNFENTPHEELQLLKNLEVEAKKKIKEEESKLRDLSRNLRNLKLVYDFYLWEKDRNMAKEKLISSDSVVLATAWVPVNEIEKIEEELSEISQNFALTNIEPEKDEIVPVEIENKGFFAPFESVTRIFGLPLSHELDPTPFLAPFFAIFFGFCLTDAGYGILLFVASLLALKFVPLDLGMRKMLRLMAMCGVTTFFMGILFGGWFGLTVEQAPEFLVSNGKFIGQKFDPINDLTDKIMPLAFGMGLLQLWFGVVLAGITQFKNGHKIEAWQTSFNLSLIIILIIVSALGFAGESTKYIVWTIYALVVVFIWGLGGADNKNPIIRLLIGVIGLANEAMGWLSNVLSYSRLFALGLATGIIAAVFNSVAVIMSGMMPPVINVLVLVFIIVFGHLINIALNLLGAFIHSGRLQFVEFFGKFLESGGRKFAPLARNSKYLFVEKF